MGWADLMSLLGLRAATVQGGPAQGYGQDIEIPNLSGRVDPQLRTGDIVGEHLRKSGEGYRKLMEATARLKKE